LHFAFSISRRFLPRPLRLRASVQLAEWRSLRLRRRLASMAADGRPILVGPWVGEVGFEVLYWVPFVRWVAREFRIDPARLVAVSRGGTGSWYRPFAGKYHEIFDYITREEFRRHHDDRVRTTGEQKQTRTTGFDRELLDRVARAEDLADPLVLHPSTMYAVLNPYWWRHVDERWVQRHARYEPLAPPDPAGWEAPRQPYVAVKFYFNDCFADTADNRAFAAAAIGRLSERTTVVSLSSPRGVDDHGGLAVGGSNVLTPPLDLDPRVNLQVQSAIVAGASAFVGTYGGFSYLAPFYGVPATAYYDDPDGFSRRHLSVALAAAAALGRPDLLDVRVASAPPAPGFPCSR
jgi:hypothetical protein